MSDIEQRITILDDFSEPLKDLKDSLKDVLLQNDLVTESVIQGKKSFGEWKESVQSTVDSLKSAGLSLGGLGTAIKLYSETTKIHKPFRSAIKSATKEFNRYVPLLGFTFKQQKIALSGIGEQVKNIGMTTSLGLKEVSSYSIKSMRNMSVFGKGFAKYRSDVSKTFKDMASNNAIFLDVMRYRFIQLGRGISNTAMVSMNAAKNISKGIKQGFIKGLKHSITGVLAGVVNRSSTLLFNATAAGYERMFKKMFASIEPYIERIEETDKMRAMFGDATAESFNNRTYLLANSLGQDAAEIGRLGSKAAYEGIGTDDFERMMKFADKISSLASGKTFEDTARTLVENVKHGHDANSISQLLGGGQLMERQLKWSGYERALHRGDINKALDIAEQIAEQAGLTEDRYKRASESMSKNFKAINNVVNNIKNRLGEALNSEFAPAIERIRDFMESDGFKRFTNFVTTMFRVIGKIFNGLVIFAIDSINLLGVLLGVSIGTKIFLIARKAGALLKIVRLAGKALMFLSGPLGIAFKWIAAMVAKLGVGKALMRAIGKAALRAFVNPLTIGIAAVVGALFIAYKVIQHFVPELESFPQFLAGMLESARNVAENIFIFFEHIGNYIVSIPTRAQSLVIRLKGMILDLIDFLAEKLRSIPVFGDDVADKMKEIASAGRVDLSKQERAVNEKLGVLDSIKTNYVDISRGVAKAMANTKSWGDLIKRMGIVDLLDGIDKKLGLSLNVQEKIKTDSGKIRQFNEQEEELAWLKAFSNRQIGSAYNQMSSQTINTTINGASDHVMISYGRRSLSSVPPRPKTA